MSRYRLYPTPAQETMLLSHCAHARYVWNLAVEQRSWRHPGRPAPGFARREGFRIVAVGPKDMRRLNRRWGQVLVPKLGWVRFRWSRPVPEARSYRVTRDRAGRWHVAFAAMPPAIPAPGNGAVIGVDRGVAVSAALSTGELMKAPGLRPGERRRLRLLERRLARAKPGSTRRRRVRLAVARLKARQADRRRGWVEKTSTDLARRFDLICVEDLDVRAMTRSASGTLQRPGRGVRQKTGLNRAILAAGWGRLVDRLEHKAPGRVHTIPAAYTSQRCSACGHAAAESRQSQTAFRCVACAWTGNADYNAARNIAAAGQVVAARGGQGSPGPVNREPPALEAVA